MGTEIEGWGDSQQYSAEPHPGYDPEHGGVNPSVALQWMTPDPLGAMAMATGMYEGKVFRHISEVTDDDRKKALEAMQRTHLTAGLEVVRFQFLLDGVDRAFTHQQVRQRTAVFFQESLRFAVLEDLMTATTLPDSLAATVPSDRHMWMETTLFNLKESTLYQFASKEERWRLLWDYVMQVISEAYNTMVNTGMPAEEARGTLPTAVATRIVYNTDLRNMIGHAGNRLCTQAQFHWRQIFSEMVNAIGNYTPDLSWITPREWEHPEGFRGEIERRWEESNRWQFKAIAQAEFFRPACYQLGHCPFQASFDRECVIRDRVEAFAKHGVPSRMWHLNHEGPNDHGMGPPRVRAINPAEWLLDASAARA